MMQPYEIDAVFRPFPIPPDELCSLCSSIDWYSLATARFDDEGQEVYQNVDKASRLQNKSCSICRVISPMVSNWDNDISVHLRIRPASSLLSTWSSKQVETNNLRNSNLLCVTYKPESHVPTDEFVGLSYPGRDFDFGIQRINHEAVDFAALKQRIDYCQNNHGTSCVPITEDGPRNLRVIDCRSKRRKIILAPPSCHYVALSYVWGKPSLVSHKKSFLSSFKRRNNADYFARVVNDAIQVVIALGYDYLWVDQHCINQDDAADKQVHIAQMDKIYAHAAFTIVAAAGQDSTYGLPGVSRPRKTQQELKIKGGVTFIYNDTNFYSHTENSVWAKRGWTLQESFLTSRRIIFTEQESYFLCNVRQLAEAVKYPLQIPRLENGSFHGYVLKSRGISGHSLEELERIAAGVLEQYGRRKLTYVSDKLAACLGILKVLQRSGLFFPWGTPLLQDGKNPTRLALDWSQKYSMHTKSEFQRVSEIPSWSSLGWYGNDSLYIKGSPDKDSDKSGYIYFGDMQQPLFSLDEVASEFQRGRVTIDACPRYLHLTGLFVHVSFKRMRWMEPLPWREPDDYVYHPTNFTRSNPTRQIEVRQSRDDQGPYSSKITRSDKGRQIEVTYPPDLREPYASLRLADDLNVWFNYDADTKPPSTDNETIGLLLGSFSYTEGVLHEAFALLKKQEDIYDFLHLHGDSYGRSEIYSAAKALFALTKVLLLKNHGEFYERIGIFDLPIQETTEGRFGHIGFCNDARERVVTVEFQDYTMPLWLKEAWVQSVVIG
ncbi:heterokaryon incompatibility protein-domain-containing protein [Xylariaceae sp. FL1272]|nr:heterokaryon incompatibility protein-domain-containing protein [Xylariaceae sp. FL1272]